MMVVGLNEKALISKSGLSNYGRMIMIKIVMMMNHVHYLLTDDQNIL